jgi:hypothetical protein
MLVIRKKSRDYINFCQDYTRDASKKPTKKFNSKGGSIVEYMLGRITRG